ncbi:MULTISPECIES: hypothetical protein [Enterococcus]|uniref:Uncharacterized protein n=1 Tax=Enterococcus sulfureus ATCC 49903 TaxID=1140003 RepID=S0L6I5_9ENTE|nr:hypothetical protein [Enterococcus sulfureus]EOT47096.1 hypothetical protein OMY_01348 [Enterococcus sulfureus ATCC 49903]EOT83609.1 hypothetical protein I573_01332 [Enterococcus sulfureus ATCC 49903]
MMIGIGDTVACNNIQGEEIKGIIIKFNDRTAIVNCDVYSHLVKLSALEALGYKWEK